ncbi:MAG: hypothetical protein U1E89_04070 [Burkholderiaceae bacterium]
MALLPLRGLAHADMLVNGAGTPTPAAGAMLDSPCPMHAGMASETSGTATDVATLDHGVGCQLCGVCHSAMLPSMTPADVTGAAPAQPPQACDGLGAGLDVPDGLFRPPRAAA